MPECVCRYTDGGKRWTEIAFSCNRLVLDFVCVGTSKACLAHASQYILINRPTWPTLSQYITQGSHVFIIRLLRRSPDLMPRPEFRASAADT